MNSNNQNHHWQNHWQHPQYRRITLEQAAVIALERVPGDVIKAELEYDDGIMLYEIDIRARDGQKYEVKIDANTGEILKVKLD